MLINESPPHISLHSLKDSLLGVSAHFPWFGANNSPLCERQIENSIQMYSKKQFKLSHVIGC